MNGGPIRPSAAAGSTSANRFEEKTGTEKGIRMIRRSSTFVHMAWLYGSAAEHRIISASSRITSGDEL